MHQVFTPPLVGCGEPGILETFFHQSNQSIRAEFSDKQRRAISAQIEQRREKKIEDGFKFGELCSNKPDRKDAIPWAGWVGRPSVGGQVVARNS